MKHTSMCLEVGDRADVPDGTVQAGDRPDVPDGTVQVVKIEMSVE